MPADFDTNITAPLGRLRALTAGATSFASDIVSLLTAAFGTSNPFGTAATRDTGTAEGNVPLLGAGGRIEPSLLPTATATDRGAVLLARDINDRRTDVIATAAQLAAHAATVKSGLEASNFTITQLTSGVAFTAPAVGLIFVAASGGGGSVPTRSGLAPLLVDGGDGEDARLRYGSAQVVVAGGQGGFRPSSISQIQRAGFSVVTLTQSPPNTPDFAVLLGGKGAAGGKTGLYDTDTSTIGTETRGHAGAAGSLLVAKVPAGGVYTATIGAAGRGAAALTGLPSGQESVGGGDGALGWAFYLRLV